MSDEQECPTCGRDDFASDLGVKLHHSKTHGESIAGVEQTCEQCGSTFRVQPHRTGEAKYCSYDCRDESYRSDRVEKQCVICGDDFDVLPSHSDQQACSWGCRGDLISKTQGQEFVTVVCEGCGDDFDAKPSHAPRRRFCSFECKGEWQTTAFAGEESPSWDGGPATITCEICGDEYQTHRPERARFCSDACKWESNSQRRGEAHPNWAGGQTPYGPGWNEAKKEAVRKTQNRRCDGCGMLEADQLEEFGRKLPVHHKQKARDFDDPEKRNRIDNLAALCDNCHPVAERMAPLYPFAD